MTTNTMVFPLSRPLKDLKRVPRVIKECSLTSLIFCFDSRDREISNCHKCHFFVSIFWIIFIPKNTISTALIIENPVKSPIVPPIAEISSTNLTALSLVTRLNVSAPK